MNTLHPEMPDPKTTIQHELFLYSGLDFENIEVSENGWVDCIYGEEKLSFPSSRMAYGYPKQMDSVQFPNYFEFLAHAQKLGADYYETTIENAPDGNYCIPSDSIMLLVYNGHYYVSRVSPYICGTVTTKTYNMCVRKTTVRPGVFTLDVNQEVMLGREIHVVTVNRIQEELVICLH